MTFIENFWSFLRLEGIKKRAEVFSESNFPTMSETMASTSCRGTNLESCRDEPVALVLKTIAIVSILIAGSLGISFPIVGKNSRFLRTDSILFVFVKAFAAGIILATGFVHMLPAGLDALNGECLPNYPWSKFPFGSFFTMMAALLTLLVDFLGTQYYERKQGMIRSTEGIVRVESFDVGLETGIMRAVEGKERNEKMFGEERGGGMHIVGMHAHAARAAHDRHSPYEGHSAGDGHGYCGGEDDGAARHVVVSQVLELGIVSHSVIVGLSLGVSNSPCAIRPLIATLCLHQFFEGFALGGCISQAHFSNLSATLMACFFAITTPAGIGIGISIASFYNGNSPGARITEGILDSMSAGILIYMALVELIAADFLNKRMRCNYRLQLTTYFMLFFGAGSMSALAIWA
ncbi:hypothetical protein I3843_16G030400 [Carya illinoinensis]|nr:hypothetical protein I3843_16G030400 [Carya illinoinensis]